MQQIGHRNRRLLAEHAPWAALGAAAALVPALWMWGFTVDDALIAVRYARHLASGLGWCFNAGERSTDGVTPLAWPVVLAPMARADPLVVLLRAKLLGLVVWTGTGSALGASFGKVRRAPLWARLAILTTLSLSVPLAAHAVSGMETALATGLATVAALAIRRPRTAALLAGLAASLRPEMAPWAFVLAVGAAWAAGSVRLPSTDAAGAAAPLPRDPLVVARQAVMAGAAAIGPFTLCVIVRLLAWGHPAPLAILAKPSDVSNGLAYAGAACTVTLVPILALAPLALSKSPAAVAVALATMAHVASIIAVGGDWMPYARLMVPVTPALAYAAALAGEHAPRVATAVRSLAALGLGVALIARGGTQGRSVGADRAALVAEARPVLSSVHCVAALDVGWVGAATERAQVVDLAGLTDPEVAALPGGHTSKRVDAMFLLSRHVDSLLLYAPHGLPAADPSRWAEAAYPRVVEARLARDAIIAHHFEPAAWLPLGNRGAGYVLLRARETEDGE